MDPNNPSLSVERAMMPRTSLDTADAVRTALGAPVAYGRWIESQRAVEVSARDRETVEVLLAHADEAKQRIAEGIEQEPEARRTFTLVNEALG